MSNNINTIGVLTSGGDAPGMNAAIRAVVRTGKYHNLKVMGIKKGFKGLLGKDVFEMSARDVSDKMQRGGTFLQTARCPEFKEDANVRRGVEIAKELGIDGLVVIGGDGSFRGARDLSLCGLPTVGIPATIDNDLPYTEFSIGFDTAVNTAAEAVDKIRDTATSHERCNIVQVMGRNCGKIALYVGVTTGAEAILIPEIPFDFEQSLLVPLQEAKRHNKQHFIVILAEGVGTATDIVERLKHEIDLDSRSTNLGYVQRGGSPTVRDRIIASVMGKSAVDLLLAGKMNKLIGIKNGQIFDMDIFEALNVQPTLPDELIELSKILSI